MKYALFITLALILGAGLFLKFREPRDLKGAAWQVFESYRQALKDHDLPSLKALSYQLSPACQDPAREAECFQKMDKVYEAVKNFKPEDFTQMISDQKQIIISSDWHVEETDLALGEAREVVYFTRKADGAPLLLSLTLPEEIVYTLKKPSETREALLAELEPRIKDSDGDTLADEVETCTYPNAPKTCVKSDPNKKDTNANGWWDSIETLFYQPISKSG